MGACYGFKKRVSYTGLLLSKKNTEEANMGSRKRGESCISERKERKKTRMQEKKWKQGEAEQ